MEPTSYSELAAQLLKDANVRTPIKSPIEQQLERIGVAVKVSRRRMHISQNELAKRTSTSVPTLLAIEKGRADTHLGTYLRIASVLKIKLGV